MPAEENKALVRREQESSLQPNKPRAPDRRQPISDKASQTW